MRAGPGLGCHGGRIRTALGRAQMRIPQGLIPAPALQALGIERDQVSAHRRPVSRLCLVGAVPAAQRRRARSQLRSPIGGCCRQVGSPAHGGSSARPRRRRRRHRRRLARAVPARRPSQHPSCPGDRPAWRAAGTRRRCAEAHGKLHFLVGDRNTAAGGSSSSSSSTAPAPIGGSGLLVAGGGPPSLDSEQCDQPSSCGAELRRSVRETLVGGSGPYGCQLQNGFWQLPGPPHSRRIFGGGRAAQTWVIFEHCVCCFSIAA